jgi:exoribonuclease II
MSHPPPSGRQILRRIARTAMLERGLLPEFSAAAEREASALRGAAKPSSAETVRDLRDRLWCSIDNDDSRDLDQLSVAERLAGDSTRVFVAVADVDVLVAQGSALNAHARHNTTSVYTAGRIFPMLPERLSTDLTSLGQAEERLAVVVEMDIDTAGTVARSDVYRAMVVNRAKLAYDAVAAWLEGSGPPPPAVGAVQGMDEQLRVQDEVAAALRARRHQHGALTLETLQTHAVFEEEALRDLAPDRKNRARELIEDLMIAANVATGRFLESRNFPSVRRVLRAPSHWARIVALAGEVGEKLPAVADALALNTFLARRRRVDPDGFADLSLAVVKSLGRGEYVAEPAGPRTSSHFGLAVSDYTHSTAPNRRFPDVITQRLVKAVLAGHAPPYTDGELSSLAAHCTVQEDNAAKVERRVSKSAAALLLENRVGEVFDGIVTGAAAKGTWVRILRPCVEGRVTRGFEGAEVGHRIRVRLVHTDVERGFIDFERES